MSDSDENKMTQLTKVSAGTVSPDANKISTTKSKDEPAVASTILVSPPPHSYSEGFSPNPK